MLGTEPSCLFTASSSGRDGVGDVSIEDGVEIRVMFCSVARALKEATRLSFICPRLLFQTVVRVPFLGARASRPLNLLVDPTSPLQELPTSH